MSAVLKVAAILLSMAIVESALFPAYGQAAPPSLSETLKWMDNTYNPHVNVSGALGHGREAIYSHGTLFKLRTSTFGYDGCKFTLRTQEHPEASLFRETYSTWIATFNLSDIDPNSITINALDSQNGLSCNLGLDYVTCDLAEVEFETRNQAPAINEQIHSVFPKLHGADHDGTNTGPTFVAVFYVDDVEYANRFVKAFRHAVILCGGKPSAF